MKVTSTAERECSRSRAVLRLLEVWIAVDFDAAKRERTLCPTDLVVEQGACGLDGKNQTGGIPVSAQLWRAVDDAVDELVRAEL